MKMNHILISSLTGNDGVAECKKNMRNIKPWSHWLILVQIWRWLHLSLNTQLSLWRRSSFYSVSRLENTLEPSQGNDSALDALLFNLAKFYVHNTAHTSICLLSQDASLIFYGSPLLGGSHIIFHPKHTAMCICAHEWQYVTGLIQVNQFLWRFYLPSPGLSRTHLWQLNMN